MRRKKTCVGLAMELISRWRALDAEFPGLDSATSLVSCEEAVLDVREYVTLGEGPNSVEYAEKEHVLVCVQLDVDGRPGVLLADPGYHLSRLIIVMHDQLYPHTGWFTQSEEPSCLKDYEYSCNPQNSKYVEWRERVTRGTAVKCQTSLIYVAQPFLDCIPITEKRNLVYNFKSLLARDPKGRLVAGMYFPVGGNMENATFTIFTDNGVEKRRTKYKFDAFRDPDNVHPSIVEELEHCSEKLRFKKRELLVIISKLANILSNQSFVEQVLEINDDICRMYL
ncbi:uncharacterized protein LOC112050639 [Bicyclus anynana]|uniref:Uncharacterized protein LOC112050639 n=1 Tax=Bicyclus anynana TaxID=110368 RepID=A0ABM3LW58_BICAN|nr:uncharacterized protein LOC112050639 [Bicyclus anynana]